MLIYWPASKTNIGDELNPWLWPRIAPPSLTMDYDIEFFAIGSILSDWYLSRTKKRKIIFGSGKRDPSPIADHLLAHCEIDFVRGPLSARALGLPKSQAITDPAYLMPLHFQPDRVATTSGGVGFVPHCAMPENQARAIASALGLRLILPSLSVEDFIAALCSCSRVVSEAMHGAILADAYRVPWMGCSFASRLSEGATNCFKWSDWMQSLAIEAEITSVLPMSANRLHPRLRRGLNSMMTRRYVDRLQTAMAENRWTLSTDAVLRQAQDRLCERLEGLCQRHSIGAAR